MSKLISKCCGAEVETHFRESTEYDLDWETGEAIRWAEEYYKCTKCHKPCEVEEKKEEK